MGEPLPLFLCKRSSLKTKSFYLCVYKLLDDASLIEEGISLEDVFKIYFLGIAIISILNLDVY